MISRLTDPSRRRFLEVLGTAAAGAAVVQVTGCSSASGSAASVGDVAAGNISDLPQGTLRVVDGDPVAIGRDAAGVYAMSLTCTHAGCDIGTQGSVSPSGLRCACHGSTFDAQGNPTGGPARGPLVHFAVEIATNGDITIHGGTEVDAAARTAVAV